jgi:isochorismate hydrolase
VGSRHHDAALVRHGAEVVLLVGDAIAGISPAHSERALQEMTDAGARIVRTAAVIAAQR